MQFHRIEKEDYAALFADPDQKIKDYLIAASKRDLSKSHFCIMISALKNFYQMNDFDDIKWNKLKRFIGETKPKHKDRAYTHDQILTLVQGAPSLKMKAMILLMASSGIRRSAIPNLKIFHLEKVGCLYKISVYEGLKGQGHYITYCSPEAAKQIDAYLEFRKRCGEPITKDSPLFRKDFDSKFHVAARKNIKSVTAESITTNFHRLLLETGLKEIDHVNPKNRKDVKMTHGFRKFFITQLVNTDIHEVIIKKLSGHKPNEDMTFNYSSQTDEELLQEYEKAIDVLTIDPANRLRKKVEKLEVEKNSYESLAAEIELLKKKIK